jgi:hypothetical protein
MNSRNEDLQRLRSLIDQNNKLIFRTRGIFSELEQIMKVNAQIVQTSSDSLNPKIIPFPHKVSSPQEGCHKSIEHS